MTPGPRYLSTRAARQLTGYRLSESVRLHRYLKLPIGIYCNAVGSTLAEQRTAREALESLPQLREFLEVRKPSNCFNGMVLPVSRSAFRGALYFQGENNSIGRWTIYRHSLPKLIENWRETFGDPDLPFGIISLFGFGPHGRDMEPESADLAAQAPRDAQCNRRTGEERR